MLRKEAELLAEKRKIAREQAYEWTKSSQLDVRDSDDEKEQRKARKAARTRVRPEATGSGDEQEQRKKKRGKLRKNENMPEDEGALFSGDEDGDSKPAAKKVREVFACGRHALIMSCLSDRRKELSEMTMRRKRLARRGRSRCKCSHQCLVS